MDDGPAFEAEFLFESSVNADDPRNEQYTGAFFPGGQNFVVAGGKFKSITNITQVAPTVPSDFRMIPMGDLDLREEIRPRHRSGGVFRGEGRASVRRVYSAIIHGSKSKMTVAVYQGENAEEEWREDILRYSWLRHPNLVQLFATASSFGIHSAIFHDDLMSVKDLADKYYGSHLSSVHLYRYLDSGFRDVRRYMLSVSGTYLHSSDCMMWIRCSTGRLCIDLAWSEFNALLPSSGWSNSPPSVALSTSEPPEDSQIIESTPLDVYHEICARHLGHLRKLSISPDASVPLGTIISYSAGIEIEHLTVIAGIPDDVFHDLGWSGTYTEPLVREDGWTRISSSELEGGHIIDYLIFSDILKSWLAQANYVFNRLGMTSNYDDYVYVDYIQYQLTLSEIGSIPPGYLFLCPLRDFESEIPSYLWLPECPAYWSLDPSGAERLSTKEADELGFPCFELEMKVQGWYWDESVYTGIRQFHEGKGYDPYSQDVARELGYSLFQLSSELVSFEETESCSGNEDFEQDDGLSGNEIDGPSGEDFSLAEGIHRLLDDTEFLEPSKAWNIVMGVQFMLILASSVFCLMSCSPLRPASLYT